MKRYLIFVFLITLLGAGCYNTNNQETVRPSENQSMSEKINFITSDNVTVVGDWYSGEAGKPVILFLHMRPNTRESWKSLAEKMVTSGFSALAIDMRGHGESINTTDGKKIDYQSFSENEEQQTITDVSGAINWLVATKNVEKNNIVIVGASIGANLALQELGKDNEIRAAVLISPGLVYRGVDTQPSLTNLKPNQSIFYIAARDDQYAALTVGALSEQTKVPFKKEIFDKGGHAMLLFSAQPNLEDEIINWIKETLSIN